MTAFDLVERVTQHRQKILVRRDDRAVQFELDHGLRFADRGYLTAEVGE